MGTYGEATRTTGGHGQAPSIGAEVSWADDVGFRTSETFFRPPALGCSATALPASLVNTCRVLLNRSETRCVFVPIRSMQFQAVIEKDEIIFIDSQGGYAVQDGEGGRLITVAWRFPGDTRDSLSAPVPVEVAFYRADGEEIQRRLIGEFYNAVQQFKQRLDDRRPATDSQARIVPFRPPVNTD